MIGFVVFWVVALVCSSVRLQAFFFPLAGRFACDFWPDDVHVAEMFFCSMFAASAFGVVGDPSVNHLAPQFEFVSVSVSRCFCHVILLALVGLVACFGCCLRHRLAFLLPTF